MNRVTFQVLSETRREEASALLSAGHYPGAYYLAGYAVECALKACVAKQVRQFDFPDKKLANAAFTHDLEQLVKVAGLETDLEQAMRNNKNLELNWTIVKDWSEQARYQPRISRAKARDFLSACSAPRNGILSWVKRRW